MKKTSKTNVKRAGAACRRNFDYLTPVLTGAAGGAAYAAAAGIAKKVAKRRRNPRLPAAQERVLLRYYAVGEPGRHRWSTIKALLKKGYLVEKDRRAVVTPKGKAYCDEHHMEIRLNPGARILKRYKLK